MQEFKNLFKKNDDKKDYKKGNSELKEEIGCLMEGVGIVFLFSYFFYRSYLALFFLSPLVIFYRKYKKEQLVKRKREQLEIQFKETLLAVQNNLQAGYSMENAFIESYQDVIRIYGKNSYMAEELRRILKGIKNGNTLENMLMDLADRSPDSEIAEFANVYSIACKTGSKWDEVISKTASVITQKIEVKEEIEILIHGKKMENKVMCMVPFFILFYMDLTSKGYFDILYHNPAGIIIMTICLAVYILAYMLGEKITEII